MVSGHSPVLASLFPFLSKPFRSGPAAYRERLERDQFGSLPIGTHLERLTECLLPIGREVLMQKNSKKPNYGCRMGEDRARERPLVPACSFRL